MGDLVIFENDMNKLHLGTLSKTSMNIFMTLCMKVKNKADERVVMTFSEIKEKSGYGAQKHVQATFVKDMNNMINQLLAVNCTITEEKTSGKKRTYRFDLFPTFIIDEDNETLEVAVNKDFMWLFNEFHKYTSLDLEEFVNFKSKYTKNMFRLIRQWKSTGKYVVGEGGQESSFEEFRKKIGVKDSYSNKEMMRSCIAPAVNEINLSGCSIKNLTYDTQYANKRGKPLSHIIFTWDAVGRESKKEIDDITASSIYYTIKEELKGRSNINEDDIVSIAKEAKKNNISDVQVKQRIKYALGRDNVNNMVGYIISLMKKYSNPVEVRNTFNNFEQRKYDFTELEKLLVDNYVEPEEEPKKEKLVKLSDMIDVDPDKASGSNGAVEENRIDDNAISEVLNTLKKDNNRR